MKAVTPLDHNEDTIEVLSYEESDRVLRLLCHTFDADKDKRIHRYLATKPISLFGGWFGWDNCTGIGTLWYPQHEGMWQVGELWESVLQFAKSKVYNGLGRKEFALKIVESLTWQGIKNMYGVAEWSDLGPTNRKPIGHGAVKFPVDTLPLVVNEYLSEEGYFFPEDLSCLFCVTHEEFLFLAGPSELIEDFKKKLPI